MKRGGKASSTSACRSSTHSRNNTSLRRIKQQQQSRRPQSLLHPLHPNAPISIPSRTARQLSSSHLIHTQKLIASPLIPRRLFSSSPQHTNPELAHDGTNNNDSSSTTNPTTSEQHKSFLQRRYDTVENMNDLVPGTLGDKLALNDPAVSFVSVFSNQAQREQTYKDEMAQIEQRRQVSQSQAVINKKWQEQLSRAGPADGDDFLQAHGFSNLLNGDPSLGLQTANDMFREELRNVSRKSAQNLANYGKTIGDDPQPDYMPKKSLPFLVSDPDSTGGEDDDSFDENDDDDQDVYAKHGLKREEVESDINDILRRQYTPTPDSYAQGIASFDPNGDDDGGATYGLNKHGNTVDFSHMSPEEQLEFDRMVAAGEINPEDGSDGQPTAAKDQENPENVDADGFQSYKHPLKADKQQRYASYHMTRAWKFRLKRIFEQLEGASQTSAIQRNLRRNQAARGFDEAARLLLEMSVRPDLPDIPRAVFAEIINAVVPKQKTINGVPLTRTASPPGLAPFLLLVMNLARQNNITFSDVEWQFVLNSIAQTANLTNDDSIRRLLQKGIDMFRQSVVVRGVRRRRDKSSMPYLSSDLKNGSSSTARFKKAVLVSAPNVRLIEQRAWLEFYSYSSNSRVLLPFMRIHDSVVYKPDNVSSVSVDQGFITPSVEEQLIRDPGAFDFHRVDEFDELNAPKFSDNEFADLVSDVDHMDISDPTAHHDEQTRRFESLLNAQRSHKYAHYKDNTFNTLLNNSSDFAAEDSIRTEKAAKSWLNQDHHPQLFNYPTDDSITRLGYMAQPDDIIDEPWMYQPPHFGDKYFPRMSGQFRPDNLAFFPACISVMNHFTARGTADVEQAEQFFKYVVNVFTNTEGYYRHVLRELRVIDKYRTLHGYQPEEDSQMAQNMEAPEGEEFRYLAGYPLIDGFDYISWRHRATQTITVMTRFLSKLYSSEKRATSIHHLIQFLLLRKKQYPGLMPVPSLHLLQQHCSISLSTGDITRARQTVSMIMSIRNNVTSSSDPLMHLSLQEMRRQESRLVNSENLMETTQVAKSTTKHYKNMSYMEDRPEVKALTERIGQSSFQSLQLDLDVCVVTVQAALYAATNNFVAVMQLINALSKRKSGVINDPRAGGQKNNSFFDDYIVSIEQFTPETKSRIFRIILSYMSLAMSQQRGHLKFGQETANQLEKRVLSTYNDVRAKFDADFAKQYPPELIQEQLQTDAQRDEFESMRHELFSAKVRQAIQPLYRELMDPQPLQDYSMPSGPNAKMRPLTNFTTIRPGHILWLFHQAQREGAAINHRLANDVFAMVAAFPGTLGSFAAYELFHDLQKAGIRVNRAMINTLSARTALQAVNASTELGKLYNNNSIRELYHQLSDTTVTLPQLLSAGATELPFIFHKEFSFLHPTTVFSLAQQNKVKLSSRMVRNAIQYFAVTRNWQAAAQIYRDAMDTAYFGNYELTRLIAKQQNVPLAQISDALPIKQRKFAQDSRRALLFSAARVGHTSLVFDVIKDWQDADGAVLTPFDLSSTAQHPVLAPFHIRNANKLSFEDQDRLFPIKSMKLLPSTTTPQQEQEELESAQGDDEQNHETTTPNNLTDDDGDEEQAEGMQSTTQSNISHIIAKDTELSRRIDKAVNKLPYNQQRLLSKIIAGCQNNTQPFVSQHLNIKRDSNLFHRLFDSILLSHPALNTTIQRRYMEFVGMSPSLMSIPKVLSSAVALAFYTTTLDRQRGSKTRNILARKSHIASATNILPQPDVSILSYKNEPLYEAVLPITTSITTNTNRAIGIDVSYHDSERYTKRHAEIIALLDEKLADLKQLVQSGVIHHDSFLGKTRRLAFAAQLEIQDNMEQAFEPAAYRNVEHHALSLKLAAQHLADHYPFSSPQEAFDVIYNTRQGLADFGLEPDQNNLPLATNFPAHRKQTLISSELQQNQLTYQTFQKMRHENIILPMNLILGSPAVHVPGLKLAIADRELRYLQPIEQNNSLSFEDKQRIQHVAVPVAHQHQNPAPVSRYNYLLGSEHIDSALTELYWRGLTITPLDLFQSINHMLQEKNSHVPKSALFAMPFVHSLTHNMALFPILDESNRAQHLFALTQTNLHHTGTKNAHSKLTHHVVNNGSDVVNDREERVINRINTKTTNGGSNRTLQDDDDYVTLNKLDGHHVVYQHQAVDMQLDTMTNLGSQLHWLTHDLFRRIPNMSEHDIINHHSLAIQHSAAPFPQLSHSKQSSLSPFKLASAHLNQAVSLAGYLSIISDHIAACDSLLRHVLDYLPPSSLRSVAKNAQTLLSSIMPSPIAPTSATHFTPTSQSFTLSVEPPSEFTPRPRAPHQINSALVNPRDPEPLTGIHSFEDVPTMTPQPSNYTYSSKRHINAEKYKQFIVTASTLPYTISNMLAALQHPEFLSSLENESLVFTPRVLVNNKQNMLLLASLFRFEQNSEVIALHLDNWEIQACEAINSVQLAYDALYNRPDILPFQETSELAPIRRVVTDQHRAHVQSVLSHSTDDETASKARFLHGVLDIAITTVPTMSQIDWLKDHYIEIETDYTAATTSSDSNQHDPARIAQRSYLDMLAQKIITFEELLGQTAMLQDAIPPEAQIISSSYTNHLTLKPSPYQSRCEVRHSQSLKLWNRELLLTLQSIRFAPNAQQMTVLDNTGPIVNWSRFNVWSDQFTKHRDKEAKH